jgi:hypothetical protein
VSSSVDVVVLANVDVRGAMPSPAPATPAAGVVGQPLGSLPSSSALLQLSSTVVEPGSDVDVTVSLRDVDGNPLVGEVTVVVVDKAMLDLKPVAELDGVAAFSQASSASIAPAMVYSGAVTSDDGYADSRDTFARRLSLDPWTPLYSWPVYPGAGAPVDSSDSDYLSLFRYQATHLPYVYTPTFTGPQTDMMAGGGGGAMPEMEMSMAPRPAAAGDVAMRGPSTATAAAPAPIKATIRSSFETTPLVVNSKATDANGDVSLKVTLPDNVGTFVVRVYSAAVYGSGGALHAFASSSATVVSRRSLTLQASLPRVSRTNDTFQCGVIARVIGATDGSDASREYAVTVLAEVLGADGTSSTSTALLLTDVTGKTATTLPNRDVAVRFRFASAPRRVGSVRVRFTASVTLADGSTASDALLVPFEVTGVMPLVVVATSFAVQGERVCVSGAWPMTPLFPDDCVGVVRRCV